MVASTPALDIYSIVSGLFFAASAYAQLNDPDPELWVGGYILAGCVLNYIVRLDDPIYKVATRMITLGNAMVLGFFIRQIVPKLNFFLSPKDFAWSVLELEEGREIVGLLLLFGHGVYLRFQFTYLALHGADDAKKPSGSSNIGVAVGAAVAVSVLAGAIYLWVYYQPAMNAKEQVEHCSGQFHDPLLKEL